MGASAAAASPLASLTDDELALLYARARERFEAAREDPVEFYDCVARDLSNRAVVAAPHHALGLRFIDYFQTSVLRMPAGAGKTSILRSYALWRIGRSAATIRGAFVSAAQTQSKSPVDVMRRLIEESPQVRQIFPDLRPHPDQTVPWRPDSFTCARPVELGNPTMVALGMDAAIPGRRWTDAYCDDVLSVDNTATKEARDALYLKFDTQVVSRLDRVGYKLVIANTPWDRADLTYTLEEAGYPTLNMGGDGYVRFGGDLGADPEDLFGDLVRPSRVRPGTYRLVGNGDDTDERLSLWPKEFTPEWVAKWSRQIHPHAWARVFLCEPLDSASARCQREWVEKAIRKGKLLRIPVSPNPQVLRRFTGVDVGGLKRGDDLSAIATIEVYPNDERRLLNLQSGHWTGPELRDRIIAESKRYDSTVFVESNAAQRYFKSFAEEKARGVRIVNFTTTAMNKGDLTWGVEALFSELNRGIWTFPADSPEVRELGEECVFYTAGSHTGDRLMALFLARQGLARSTTRTAGVGRPQLSMATGGGF